MLARGVSIALVDRWWERHRRHPPAELAGNVERRAARGEHRDGRARCEQGGGNLRAGVEEVLAVVEDDQRPLRTQPANDAAEAVDAVFGEECSSADGAGDERRLGHGREIDPPHTVGEGLGDLGGHLLGEPGLARAPEAGERDQPVLEDEPRDGVDGVEATDEGRQRDRQVVRDGVERAQRREVGLDVGVGQLPYVLGPRQVLEAVDPEVEKVGVRAELVDDQIPSG